MTGQDSYQRLIDDFGSKLDEAARTYRPRRAIGRPSSRVTASCLALAGTVAVVVGVLLTGINGGSKLDLIAQAQAALTPQGQIVYLAMSTSTQVHDTSGGYIVFGPPFSEQWATSSPLRYRIRLPLRRRHHVEFSYGKGSFEFYNPEGERNGTDLTVETGLNERTRGVSRPNDVGFDPVAEVRSMLNDGELRDAGHAEIDGRAVRRLSERRHLSQIGSPQRIEYFVDPQTYAPVQIRLIYYVSKRSFHIVRSTGAKRPTNIGTITGVIDIRKYKRLPLNEQTEKLLEIQPHGTPRVRHFTPGQRDAPIPIRPRNGF